MKYIPKKQKLEILRKVRKLAEKYYRKAVRKKEKKQAEALLSDW